MYENQVTLLGNLGQTPELRYTQAGKPVLNLRIATTESWKVDDGWRERTEWHSVVLWGDLATRMSKKLGVGDHIYVSGQLRTRSFGEDNDKKYRTEIHARRCFPTRGQQTKVASETPPPDDGEEIPNADDFSDDNI